MTTLPEALAAPITRTLAGKVIRFARQTFGHRAELTQWMNDEQRRRVAERRAEYLGVLKDALNNQLALPRTPSPVEWGKLVLQLAAEAESFTVRDLAALPEAHLHALWIAARELQPEITKDELHALLEPLSSADVVDLLDEVVGVAQRQFSAAQYKAARDARWAVTKSKYGEAIAILNELLGEPDEYMCRECGQKVQPEEVSEPGRCPKCGGTLDCPPALGATP